MKVYLVKEVDKVTPVVIIADKVFQGGQLIFSRIHVDENDVEVEEPVYGAANGAWRTWRYIRQYNESEQHISVPNNPPGSYTISVNVPTQTHS